MDLDTRLRDLCQQGDRAYAVSLAKAALKNEPIREVVIDDSQMHIDTARFRGVHRLSSDHQRAVDIQSEGEYTYKDDTVDLSFTTATMNDRAYELAREQLADPTAAKPEPPSVSAESTPAGRPNSSAHDDSRRTPENWLLAPLARIKNRLPFVFS